MVERSPNADHIVLVRDVGARGLGPPREGKSKPARCISVVAQDHCGEGRPPGAFSAAATNPAVFRMKLKELESLMQVCA